MIHYVHKVDDAKDDAAQELLDRWLTHATRHAIGRPEAQRSVDQERPAVLEPHLSVLKVFARMKDGPCPWLLHADGLSRNPPLRPEMVPRCARS
jgi:hypothetical protein